MSNQSNCRDKEHFSHLLFRHLNGLLSNKAGEGGSAGSGVYVDIKTGL